MTRTIIFAFSAALAIAPISAVSQSVDSLGCSIKLNELLVPATGTAKLAELQERNDFFLKDSRNLTKQRRIVRADDSALQRSQPFNTSRFSNVRLTVERDTLQFDVKDKIRFKRENCRPAASNWQIDVNGYYGRLRK